MKDLPKTVPDSVTSAVAELIDRLMGEAAARAAAQQVYISQAYQAMWREPDAPTYRDAHRMAYSENPAKARALVEWGLMVRASLSKSGLISFVETRDAVGSLSLVTLALDLNGQLEGRRIKNRLRLALDSEAGLFYLDTWLDGFLMESRRLNSAADICDALLPEMLHRIHSQLADDGIWHVIDAGVRNLGNVRNDR